MAATALFSEHVLAVPDLARATAWWRNALGFEVTFEIPGWTFMRLGECRLRLGECPHAPPPTELGDHQYFAFIHVDDVDALHARLKRHGVLILKSPIDEPWGLREMAVSTPDGHRIMIGQAI